MNTLPQTSGQVGAVIPVSKSPSPSPWERLAAELVELERRYPPPSQHDIVADCRWFQDHLGTPAFAPYRGTHVAIYQGTVVGSGDNSLQLELDLARKFGIHPQRFVIGYIPHPCDC